MKAYFQKRILKFNKPAGTSRGVLQEKPSWYIFLYNEKDPSYKGIGEVSIIPGLSIDDTNSIEQKLSDVCAFINAGVLSFEKQILDFPAIRFGLETALLDFKVKGSKIIYSSDFTEGTHGIKTNGLIWMDSYENMQKQVSEKLDLGFRCLKMKIGAIDLQSELKVLQNIRKQFSKEELEIRVDANGAFSFIEAKEILKFLADLEIHSIEQPILPSQLDKMAELCQSSLLPIALDEELIGTYPYSNKKKIIEIIKPQYIILKPSLLGGFKECAEWIEIAKKSNVEWWVTSALESNIGLNAIAQWVATFNTNMYQGLGLGNLYEKNIDSPLSLNGEKLFYDPLQKWSYEFVY